MGVVASKGVSFTPCPAGSHVAVCCDVVDLGIVVSKYKDKEKKQHKVTIVWQVAEDQDNGQPFTVRKRYTNSLHEKATMRKDLESWRGRAFTDSELEGFDLDNLLSVPAMISVVHNAVQGSVYANVAAIMKLPKGVPAITVSPSYVRVQDRPKEGEPGGAPPEDEWTATDDDVPF